MPRQSITVFELAPAADELWVLSNDSRSGYLFYDRGLVALPDVARGAKLRPHVSAAYASGKATNILRVFDAFLRPDADASLAEAARESLDALLVTFLPGQPAPYFHPSIPGEMLQRLTPGGAYLACLQARDFHSVRLDLAPLPPTDGVQADRRCANILAADGCELANFSPYLLWTEECVQAVLDRIATQPVADVVALAGSLPRVCDEPSPDIYARAIAAIRARGPETLVSLDVGGAPVNACLEAGPEATPDILCVNMDEYGAVPSGLWAEFTGTAVVHNKRGTWALRGETPSSRELEDRGPDVPVPSNVSVLHTICAGDAAHGGLVMGLMLYGADDAGLHKALVLSQACAIAVVESHDSIRGLTAEKVEGNLARFA